MGFLTTIVLHNDAMGAFKENPEAFGKAILAAMAMANLTHDSADAFIGSY